MSRLEMLNGRLENLQDFLKEEPDKQSLYANDLKITIKQVQAEIRQLEFANRNPEPLIVNNASIG